jgi:hypothetical protein
MAGNLTAMIAAAFSGSAAPPVTSDPYFEYTTLLLPGNGTNGAQNNTFLDSSTNNFTITRNGNTTQGTFSPFSQTGWGNYFDGSVDSLSLASNAAFAYGTSDFTWEVWVFPTASTWTSGSGNFYIIEHATNGGTLFYYQNRIAYYNPTTGTGSALYTSGGTVAPNQWSHIAVSRESGTTRIYVNGQLSTSGSDANNYAAQAVTIGRSGGGTQEYFGYMSNVRIVKGRAVYTSAFTPPTTPLTRTTGGTNPPQGTECSLLTCQSNRFLDSNGVNIPASSPLTITVNGNTSVQAFSPFNPSASWSAATYGGSGYFDGTGDYLSAASNAAFTLGSSTDFCVEAWIYSTGTPGTDAVIAGTWQNGSSAFANRWLLSLRTSGTVIYWWDSTGSPGITYTGITTNQWVHIAVARSSSTITLYVNGVSRGTQTTNQAYTTQDSLKIGGGITGTADFPGYISNFRLVVGSPVYTSAFTPPTAPLTAITNTSLLLNYTNAGIYDATSKNDLETVGNAQISTAISAKWGSGSMYFNGTNPQHLLLNYPPTQNALNGAFTIDFWIYWISGTGVILSSDEYVSLIAILSTGKIEINTASSPQSTGTISANTWTYLAFTRNSSGVWTLYINGSADALSLTNTSTYTLRRIGGRSADNCINGYLQDFRVTKGYVRAITTPTAAFPTL